MKLFLFVIFAILLLPIWLPYAIVSSLVFDRYRYHAAKMTVCENCATPLGLKAIELADELQSAYVVEMREKFAGARLRLKPRHVWAICGCCGAKYTYNGKYILHGAKTDAELAVEVETAGLQRVEHEAAVAGRF